MYQLEIPGLLHLVKCPKHHVYYIWKSELSRPTRICPVCLQFSQLRLKHIRASYKVRSKNERDKAIGYQWLLELSTTGKPMDPLPVPRKRPGPRRGWKTKK
jgi:hypothetical protein